ncbi:hypothetical protein J6590_052430 [Homalodisca vitripennis]|nr:hypothetical protein J6590_052430 [Homalodisca vitripennis]
MVTDMQATTHLTKTVGTTAGLELYSIMLGSRNESIARAIHHSILESSRSHYSAIATNSFLYSVIALTFDLDGSHFRKSFIAVSEISNHEFQHDLKPLSKSELSSITSPNHWPGQLRQLKVGHRSDLGHFAVQIEFLFQEDAPDELLPSALPTRAGKNIILSYNRCDHAGNVGEQPRSTAIVHSLQTTLLCGFVLGSPFSETTATAGRGRWWVWSSRIGNVSKYSSERVKGAWTGISGEQ